MNKLYLWGIIITVLMLVFTWTSVAGSKGGLNGDIVNMLTVAGAVALVIITVVVVIKYVRQMQTDKADGKLVDKTWDGIGEYTNELPFGWSVSFLILIVWGMWYFTAGYPVNSYSQIGEYNEDTAAHNVKFEAQYKDIKGERLIDMGESVFLAECKVCHGLTADGIDGTAADLNHRISAASVKYVIENGSDNYLLGHEQKMPDRYSIMNANNGYMPITDEEIEIVSKYVADGMKGDGAEIFAGACAICHGPNGLGIDSMAPNIKNASTALVVNVLNHGKKGTIGKMPAFDRLNAKQKEAVGAYISSLSK